MAFICGGECGIYHALLGMGVMVQYVLPIFSLLYSADEPNSVLYSYATYNRLLQLSILHPPFTTLVVSRFSRRLAAQSLYTLAPNPKPDTRSHIMHLPETAYPNLWAKPVGLWSIHHVTPYPSTPTSSSTDEAADVLCSARSRWGSKSCNSQRK